jgi:hypothetical protein
MGLRISLKEAYKRFRWTPPAEGEPCLQFPPNPTPTAGRVAVPHHPPTSPPSRPPLRRKMARAPHRRRRGPRRNPQTANLEMPDPQVDAAGFYSAAATMPALGYAIPNEPR